MQYLFQSWPSLSAAAAEAAHILLLSDYDGTLTPIVGHPDAAILSPAVREQLRALAERSKFSVGVISGRSLASTRAMVGLDGIYYAGNHGLEIEGPGISYVHPSAMAARPGIAALARQLSGRLKSIGGVVIEDKGLSLSVHYRLVAGDEQAGVADVFREVTSPLLVEGKIKVTSGKKVWEVRPPLDWHKGRAVALISGEIARLLNLEQLLTIYLGDDSTDEDAFRVLRPPQGWSVYVGREASSGAAYYLNSPAEVADLLSRLLEL